MSYLLSSIILHFTFPFDKLHYNDSSVTAASATIRLTTTTNIKD